MATLDQSEIMQLAGEGKAEELRQTLRRKCFAPNGGLYYFTKVVLGYKELVPNFHLELCNNLQNTIHLRKRAFLQPRGHFKSTIIGKSYPLWRLVGGGSEILEEIIELGGELNEVGFPDKLCSFYKSYPQMDPRNYRVLIIGESDTVAQKDLRDPKWNILNNDLLRWLFPEIIPPNINDTKWTDSEITLPRTKSFDESTITCDGVGAKRTGFHWDLLLYEDIFGEKASKSEALAEEVLSWFQFAAGMLNDPERSEELMAGTRWKFGKSDVYGWIKEEMPKRFHWVERSVYNEDGQIGFHQRFSQEVLDAILEREGPYKFSCNYLNDPTPPEGGDFKDSDFRYYEIKEDQDGRKSILTPTDGSAPIALKWLARSSVLDPSSGGQAAGSENAVVFVGGDHLKRIFVLAIWSRNCSMGAAVEEWHKLNDKFLCRVNRYEAVGAHKEIGDIIKQRAIWPGYCLYCKAQLGVEVKHAKLRPEEWRPPGGSGNISKEDRVRDYLQLPMEEHRVYIQRNMLKLKTQVVSFPHYHLKDLADALATAVKHCEFPPAPEELEAQQKEVEHFKNNRSSCIATKYEYGGYC